MTNLYVDDVRVCPSDYWVVARTVDQAKWYLTNTDVYQCSLDHDMGEGLPTGTDLVRWMIETGNWPTVKPMVHSDNPYGARRMRGLIDQWFGHCATGPMF